MRWNMQKREKNIPNIIGRNLENIIIIFLQFLAYIFLTQLAINDCLSFYLSQCLLLQYLGKSDQAKYELKWQQNVDTFRLSWSVASNSQCVDYIIWLSCSSVSLIWR